MDLEIHSEMAVQGNRNAQPVGAMLRAHLQHRIELQTQPLVSPVIQQLAELKNPTNPELAQDQTERVRLQNEGTLLQARVIAIQQIQNLQIREQELSIAASDNTKNPEQRQELEDAFQAIRNQIEKIQKSHLNGIPLFPEGREVVHQPGDPLYKRIRSEITEAERNEEQRFLQRDLKIAKFSSDSSDESLEQRSKPADPLVEDRLPIYTPVNGSEEQLTVVDREGFIQMGKSIDERERILYEVDNSFLQAPTPDAFFNAEIEERVPADSLEVLTNDPYTKLNTKPENPALEKPPEHLEPNPHNPEPVEKEILEHILKIGTLPTEDEIQEFPEDTHDDGRQVLSRLPIVNDLHLMTIEETKKTIKIAFEEYERMNAFKTETLYALSENRQDLESVSRSIASSDIDMTHPEQHTPQILPYGHDNFYSSQIQLLSSHAITLLKS